MASIPVSSELPPEGDPQEARIVVERTPVKLPQYRLDRVHVAILNVDYAPPHGSGYARPLSQGRLQRLRRDWDPLACGPLVISRRPDNTLWVIDGNHRRVIAFEKGVNQLPAQVLSGLERSKEADLYTKLGTVFGQTPATRFRAKLVSGDPAAVDIDRIVRRNDLDLDLAGGTHRDGTIQAIARVEWIYARGGEEALTWVLKLIAEAFDGERGSLSEGILEGVFGFWLRYANVVNRNGLVERLRGAGLMALDDRSVSILKRYVTTPGNAVGRAMADLYNSNPPKGAARLPSWQEKVVGPSIQAWQAVRFFERGAAHSYQISPEPAPQHLTPA